MAPMHRADRRPHSGPLPPLPGACRTVTSGQASTRGQPGAGPASLPSGTSPTESSSTCSAPGSSPKATPLPLWPGVRSRLPSADYACIDVINTRMSWPDQGIMRSLSSRQAAWMRPRICWVVRSESMVRAMRVEPAGSGVKSSDEPILLQTHGYSTCRSRHPV
jgi:hypothetical protein